MTLHHPPGCAFRIAEEHHRFSSARDAIDAVSAFEAATLADWEYEIRAVDDQPLIYVAAVKSLGPVPATGRYVSGYLEYAQ